ncbi:MAG: hypothetical protein HY751_02650 [Nitrospinae bacterium]|nr:hypothetical protein [Nitrospinota bacterium]
MTLRVVFCALMALLIAIPPASGWRDRVKSNEKPTPIPFDRKKLSHRDVRLAVALAQQPLMVRYSGFSTPMRTALFFLDHPTLAYKLYSLMIIRPSFVLADEGPGVGWSATFYPGAKYFVSPITWIGDTMFIKFSFVERTDYWFELKTTGYGVVVAKMEPYGPVDTNLSYDIYAVNGSSALDKPKPLSFLQKRMILEDFSLAVSELNKIIVEVYEDPVWALGKMEDDILDGDDNTYTKEEIKILREHFTERLKNPPKSNIRR